MPGLRGSLCPGATDNSQTGCLPASQVLRSAMRASQSQTKCQTWGWAPPKYTTDTITPPRQSRAPTSADRPLVPGELGQPCKAKKSAWDRLISTILAFPSHPGLQPQGSCHNRFVLLCPPHSVGPMGGTWGQDGLSTQLREQS